MKSKVYREARRYYPKYLMNDTPTPTHKHTQMQEFTLLIKDKEKSRRGTSVSNIDGVMVSKGYRETPRMVFFCCSMSLSKH